MTCRLSAAGFAVTMMVLGGCKDDSPPPTPPGMPGVPSGQMPPGHPAVDSNARVAPGMPSGEMPPGHPSVDSSAEMAPGANGSPAVADEPTLPTAPSGTIDGRIELAAAVQDKAEAGDAIYVVARNAATGTIVAAARVVAPAQFPVSFSLSGSDVMHTQTSLAGKVKLEVRLDKDGDAMTKNPGDLIGETDGLVTVPAKDVVVTLDRVL